MQRQCNDNTMPMRYQCHLVPNQVPLHHSDATETNPLPLRPNLGQFYQWTATLPIICHSATGVPLDIFQCHSAPPLLGTLPFILSRDNHSTNSLPIQCHCKTTQPMDNHSTNPFATEPSGIENTQWHSSGRVANNWQSGCPLVKLTPIWSEWQWIGLSGTQVVQWHLIGYHLTCYTFVS